MVLSPSTVNSPWVRYEVNQALEVEKSRDGYRVIPLLLPGISVQALGMWFPQEPVAVPVEVGAGGLSVALPALLAPRWASGCLLATSRWRSPILSRSRSCS